MLSPISAAVCIVVVLIPLFLVVRYLTNDSHTERRGVLSVVVVTLCGETIHIATAYAVTYEMAHKTHRQVVDVFRNFKNTTATTTHMINEPTQVFKGATIDVTFSDEIIPALTHVLHDVNEGQYIPRLAHRHAVANRSNPKLDAELDDLTGQTFELSSVWTRWHDDMFCGALYTDHECDQSKKND